MNCARCGKPIEGAMYGSGNGGGMHRWCFYREFPTFPVNTITAMFNTNAARDVAARLLETYIPDHVKQAIIRDYNTVIEKTQEQLEKEPEED